MNLKTFSFEYIWPDIGRWHRPLVETNLIYSERNKSRMTSLSMVLKDDIETMEVFKNYIIDLCKSREWIKKLKDIIKLLKRKPTPKDLVQLEIISICLWHAVEIRFSVWQDENYDNLLEMKDGKIVGERISMTPELNHLQATIDAFLKNNK